MGPLKNTIKSKFEDRNKNKANDQEGFKIKKPPIPLPVKLKTEERDLLSKAKMSQAKLLYVAEKMS